MNNYWELKAASESVKWITNSVKIVARILCDLLSTSYKFIFQMAINKLNMMPNINIYYQINILGNTAIST